ncbi:unnamed protein product, partial [Staurois parvus]
NEKIEVQRQAEKDSGDLHKQVKVLEVELEEQVSRNMEMEQEKNAILEDLRQKNFSLEKQLEKTRRFLDVSGEAGEMSRGCFLLRVLIKEQAVDREHERDVFQQEIQKLEQQLKMPQRHQPVNDHQSNEVEKLEGHLKEKTDKCSELLLCKEQLQRDVQERNEEIEKLECRIRELEQALLISADTLQKVEDRRPSFAGAKGEMPLEAQLQVEREAIDRKEKEVTNLVEQLEQFREELENKNEEVQQLHMQLEIQRKESATRLQELEQENKVLKICSAFSKDELEMTPPEETSSAAFRQGKMDDLLLSKDQEILLLGEQIRKLQAQLEAATDNKMIEENNEKIKQYKSQIKCLKSDQERLKKNSEEEIEKLNEVIEKLQEELSLIEPKVTVSFTSMAEKQLEEAQQRTSLSAVQECKSKKLELTDQMNGGEVTFIKTLDAKADNEYEEQFGQLYSTREKMNTLDTSKRMSDGDVTAVMENKDQCDWMIEALRDQNTQLLSNQSLFTSVQETMQSTIDSLETQLEELQKVVKEKDMEILLYLEEMETLKEQVKVKTDEYDQIMLAMEDSLREKVAAALVSEAQLKAIQLHTKHMHADDRSSAVMEESKLLKSYGPNLSQEGESESKSVVLNLQLLELEKQLTDLHEQLQVERDQVIFTNQLAAEKEKQVVELQQLLKNRKEKQSITWAATETRDVALLQSSENTITDLEHQLHTLAEEAIATKDELCHYREMSEKLKEELMVKDSSLVHLEEDLREVKKCLSNAEEKLAFYMKREIQEEELQSMSDIDLPCVQSPDWTTLDRTTSSSQTDRIPSVNNSNQTSHIPRKHVGVQNDLETGQLSSSSDEVAEIMEQYTEKISQMQELHAAEILDMESRHISEADSLRREQYTVVQALTDECDALKAVIEALKSPVRFFLMSTKWLNYFKMHILPKVVKIHFMPMFVYGDCLASCLILSTGLPWVRLKRLISISLVACVHLLLP